MSWKEFQDICAGVDPDNIPFDVAWEVYKTCVVKGPDIRLITAGIGMFIAKQQIQNNPFAGDFKSINAVLTTARNYVASNYLLAAQAIVANTFKYSLDEIKEWSAEKFFLRVAQAEVLLGNKLNPAPPPDLDKASKQPKKKLSTRETIEKKVQERDKG